MCALCFAAGLFALPRDPPVVQGYTLDYIGFMLSTTGLVLLNFAFNQGPAVGWEIPYGQKHRVHVLYSYHRMISDNLSFLFSVYALLIVGVLALVATYIYEARLGSAALIPTEVLHKNALLVYLCLWLGWMSFGIFLQFMVSFIRDVRGYHSPLSIIAQMSPLAPGGVITAVVIVPFVFQRFAGHWIFAAAMLS